MRQFIVISLVVTALSWSFFADAQESASPIPQVFSPNATELGRYGKIPVDYANGLPNIQIPLTSLQAKGDSIPVYLAYHASGNRPDIHPGWVGQGWSLHAGGCINRIIHGMRDDLANDEEAYRFSSRISTCP